MRAAIVPLGFQSVCRDYARVDEAVTTRHGDVNTVVNNDRARPCKANALARDHFHPQLSINVVGKLSYDIRRIIYTRADVIM